MKLMTTATEITPGRLMDVMLFVYVAGWQPVLNGEGYMVYVNGEGVTTSTIPPYTSDDEGGLSEELLKLAFQQGGVKFWEADDYVYAQLGVSAKAGRGESATEALAYALLERVLPEEYRSMLQEE